MIIAIKPSSMRFTLYLLFTLICCIASSQNKNQIDSLKLELKNSEDKAQILNQIAQKYLTISSEEANKYADKALGNAVIENDSTQMGEALRIKAEVHISQNNYEKSRQLADSAILIFRELKNHERVINCQVLKATAYMLQGEYETALELYERCIEQAMNLDTKDIYASILIQMGRIYRVIGNYKEAMENFQRVKTIAEESDNNYLKAHAYHFIGLVHEDQQNFELAIENYLIALPLFEQENIVAQMPYLLISLGSSCRASKNYSESIKYFNQANTYLQSLNDRWGLSEVNRNKGLAYMDMDKLDSAWICFDRSLKYSKEINEKAGECSSMNYMGEILVNQQKYKLALEYLDTALTLNSQINNKLYLTNILFNRGKCKVYMGNYNEGLNLLKRSLYLADSLDIRYEKMVINKEISTAYSKLKKYKKALDHYEIYAELNDSIYKAEANHDFIQMEKKYQSEKQKQEIGQLKLDKIEQDVSIKKQRSARNIFILGFLFASIISFLSYKSYRVKKKADMEKESLLKEIHHRVKNNLQVISSLLSIQTENVSDTKVISAVKESQSRVKAMALIHQLLYQEKNLSQIDFSTYLPQLSNALSSIFKKEGATILTEINAENISFDIDTAIPLGLIVAELIANAYKYAFNDIGAGKITINMEKIQGEEYLLSVTDNGPGLPEGINIKELNSMGLRLVNILTDQLDGVFNYKYMHGAIFTLKFTYIN